MLGTLAIATLAAVAPDTAFAQTVVTVPSSGDLRATIYEGQGALFSDRRHATLAAGVNELRIEDVPAPAEPSSLDLHVLSGPAVRLLERTDVSRPQLPSSGLAALIGQTVTVVRRSADGQATERLEGTLLGVSDRGAISALRVGDRVILDPRGEIEVSPEQLATLSQPSSVVLRVESAAAGEADLLVSYLIHEATWAASHVVSLNADASTMNLAAWARVHIPGAGALALSALRLVAGAFSSASGASVYDLPQATTLGADGDVRLALASATGVPVTNLLLFDGGELEKLATGGAANGPVLRVTRFDNTKATGLGAPLPDGDVLVYQVSDAGVAKLISRGKMPGSDEGATVDLALGEVGGLRGVSRQDSWRELSPEDIERKCSMTVTAATPAAQTVTCGVTMSGKWRIAESTHEYVVRPGDRVEFAVPLAVGERSATVSYTVRTEVPSGRAKPPAGDSEAPATPSPQ
jgi:hypothetical protein